jgi:hypothetical protein
MPPLDTLTKGTPNGSDKEPVKIPTRIAIVRIPVNSAVQKVSDPANQVDDVTARTKAAILVVSNFPNQADNVTAMTKAEVAKTDAMVTSGEYPIFERGDFGQKEGTKRGTMWVRLSHIDDWQSYWQGHFSGGTLALRVLEIPE